MGNSWLICKNDNNYTSKIVLCISSSPLYNIVLCTQLYIHFVYIQVIETQFTIEICT